MLRKTCENSILPRVANEVGLAVGGRVDCHTGPLRPSDGQFQRKPFLEAGSDGLCAVVLSSRSKLIGLLNLDAKCAGARSAGNPHATCDAAGTGKERPTRLRIWQGESPCAVNCL